MAISENYGTVVEFFHGFEDMSMIQPPEIQFLEHNPFSSPD